MNIHRVLNCTTAEGPGKRFVLWTQGCHRHCDGCFSVQTWSSDARILLTPSELADQILEAKQKSGIEGITVLGGEPFEQVQELRLLLELIPGDLSVLLFTGYTLEELQASENGDIAYVLKRTDVLVDGPFVKEKKQDLYPMIGSSNQRFHFFSDRYQLSDFPSNRLQIRINKNGGIELNGMDRPDALKRVQVEVKKHEQ